MMICFTFINVDSPCMTNPCANGGQCMVTADQQGTGCICPAGFSGALCNDRKYISWWVVLCVKLGWTVSH